MSHFHLDSLLDLAKPGQHTVLTRVHILSGDLCNRIPDLVSDLTDLFSGKSL